MAEPRTYAFAAWLFLRLLGVIYLAAFVSLAKQIRGLAGREGILPACESLAGKDPAKLSRFWRLPTLCWLSTSDQFLLSLCWGGAALAAILAVGFAQLLLLILLWMFYLSLFNVCRLFLAYQWDVLLLEAGFLAIFLAPVEWWPPIGSKSPPVLFIWLFWWLLFRLMFSSGFAKLRSGDKSWRNLTALCYHYQTQPLPTPAAWFAHQLPSRFHKISTAVVLVIELLGPVFMLGPPPVRHVVCAAFIALMLIIELTGNYAFLNLLAIALSLLLLDDAVWRSSILRFIPDSAINYRSPNDNGFLNGIAILVAIVVLFISCDVVAKLLRQPLPWPTFLIRFLEVVAPFHLVSSYGLFAVITTERPEIIVEGSEDGLNWHAYEFKWKPGAVGRIPRFVAPHQPRLDWQLWFAALGYCDDNPWFMRFLLRLLEGSQPVLHLLKTNPFARNPPRYIRASVYDYRFTNASRRKTSRVWWVAERRGTYCPALESAPRGVDLER